MKKVKPKKNKIVKPWALLKAEKKARRELVKQEIEKKAFAFVSRFREVLSSYISELRVPSSEEIASQFGYLKNPVDLSNIDSKNKLELFTRSLENALNATSPRRKKTELEIINEISIQEYKTIIKNKDQFPYKSRYKGIYNLRRRPKNTFRKTNLILKDIECRCGRPKDSLFDQHSYILYVLNKYSPEKLLHLKINKTIITKADLSNLEPVIEISSNESIKSLDVRSYNKNKVAIEYKEDNSEKIWNNWSRKEKQDENIKVSKISEEDIINSNESIRYENKDLNVNKNIQLKNIHKDIKKEKIIGDILVQICMEMYSMGKAEPSICIRCGYETEKIGSFRRAFSKAAGVEFAPLDRMISLYRQKKTINKRQKVETNLFIDRHISKSSINRRARSSIFRKKVLETHGSNCACCNISIIDLLEAAHIIPVEMNGSDSPANGIPLCPTHHTAFDSLLFTIDPKEQSILLKEELTNEELGITKKVVNLDLSKEALEFRFSMFNDIEIDKLSA